MAANKPVLDDLLRPGLKAVFCGMAAGKRSAELRMYYAGPGNKFWRILHATGLTRGSAPLRPDEWSRLEEFDIGLTDLVKTHFGSDASLPSLAFDPGRLHDVILQYAPTVLAFNGKKAAQVFFDQPVSYGRNGTIGSTEIWVLPSTSGAASGFWDDSHWHELARKLQELPRR